MRTLRDSSVQPTQPCAVLLKRVRRNSYQYFHEFVFHQNMETFALLTDRGRVWLMPTHLGVDFMEMFTSMRMKHGRWDPQVG